MYMEGWTKEVFRAKCNPQFQSVHCIAHLDCDIREVLPYLNSVLGGYTYIEEPPSVTFKLHGKLVTVHAREIAINALEDEDEADRLLNWLKQQINETWEKRAEISPSYQSAKTADIGTPQAAPEDKLREVRPADVHGICHAHD